MVIFLSCRVGLIHLFHIHPFKTRYVILQIEYLRMNWGQIEFAEYWVCTTHKSFSFFSIISVIIKLDYHTIISASTYIFMGMQLGLSFWEKSVHRLYTRSDYWWVYCDLSEQDWQELWKKLLNKKLRFYELSAIMVIRAGIANPMQWICYGMDNRGIVPRFWLGSRNFFLFP